MKSPEEQLNEILLVEDNSIEFMKEETSEDLSDMIFLMTTSSIPSMTIPDMDYAFKNSKFNKDISKWTVSDVNGMNFIF